MMPGRSSAEATIRATGHGPILLAALGALLVAWSMVVPVFEQPDEPAHWQYARYVHDHWRLPLYEPGFEEANSPPLYYALVAPLATPSPLPSILLVPLETGGVVSLAPPRMFLNTDRDLGRYLSVRLVRALSIPMSLVTVWLTFRIGLAASGRRDIGLLAALVAALLPQFSFRGSGISNDALVTALAAATTLGVVVLLRRGFTWSRGVWTGVALAGTYLTKISAIALLAPVVYALVASDATNGAPPPTIWRRLLRSAALLPAAAIVLPWTLRNISLYGDPFASGAMHTAVSHLITERSIFSGYFLKQFPLRLGESFLGNFGWMSVLLPVWMYILYAALALAAAFGLARAWRRGLLDARLAAALALTFLSTLAIVVYVNLSFTQPQGRYLFPALPAMATLVGLGLASLPQALAGLGRPLALGAVLAALNVYALAGVALPAYHPAPTRDTGPGVRRVQPVLISGLAYAPGTKDYVFTGENPGWFIPVDVAATEYRAIGLALRASLEPRGRKGCLYFATETREIDRNTPVCFTWIADGSTQHIVVPMAAHPEWTGRVTHVRVHPLDRGEASPHGARIALEHVELRAENK